jgi:predicted MPP superfamily phosphohydrolase
MIFFAVSISILFLAYFYLGRRLISPSGLSPTKKRVLWLSFLVIPLLMPLSFLFRFLFKNSILIDLMGWIAFVLIGFFSLVIILLMLKDIINLSLRMYTGIKHAIRGKDNKQKYPINPDRRRFIINSINFGILGSSAFLTGFGMYEARRKAVIQNIAITIPHLPTKFEGFRIAQFTDLHVGPTIKRKFVQSVVDQINKLNANLIVCTGDLVDDLVSNIREDVSPIKDLYAPKGVYFVTGNHEYYVGVESWLDEIDRLGLTLLLDKHRLIEQDDQKIILAGVTDYGAKQFVAEHRSDPQAALAQAPDGHVKILLAHQPRNIFTAANTGYDLQISGHTHGGQYFPWSMLVTLGQPYVSGLHKHDNTWIYVNRGTGYWGPPIRLGVPSEITVFTLTKQKPV